ncbi:MAG: hypothetical protein ACFFDT_29720, partial [Candidatus Hodarchaeota archaeon]
ISAKHKPDNRDFFMVPGSFNDPSLRILIHETLHHWQCLSQSFITDMAILEWENLRKYMSSKNNQFIPSSDFLNIRKKFLEVDPKLKFSAFNLSEALCRTWDIHIFGPLNMMLLDHEKIGWTYSEAKEKIKSDEYSYIFRGERAYKNTAFDLLMQVDDLYAEPYRYMLKKYDTLKTAVLFPVVTYYALQTADPINVFVKTVEFIIEKNKSLIHILSSAESEDEQSVHYFWPFAWWITYMFINSISQELTGKPCISGWEKIKRSINTKTKTSLSSNPVYIHYSKIFDILLQRKINAINIDFIGEIKNLTLDFENKLKLDFLFALPGEPHFRDILVRLFPPSLIELIDGVWGPENEVYKNIPDPFKYFYSPRELAEIAFSIRKQYLIFRRSLPPV